MIDGKPIKIGEKEYVVPALSFAQVRKSRNLLDKIGKIPEEQELTEEHLDMMREITHMGLQRNYPDITKEELEEILDLDNIYDVMEAITGASNLKEKLKRSGILHAE